MDAAFKQQRELVESSERAQMEDLDMLARGEQRAGWPSSACQR